MENSLYPIKFTPIYKTTIWGGNKFKNLFNRVDAPLNCGESWEVSSVEGCESVACNGFLAGNTLSELIEVYMGDLVGDAVYEKFGLEFPLLVKFIDANDCLSVQVHPGDDLALERHNSYGKNEMWYVLECDKGGRLVNGFARKTSRQEYSEALAEGRLMDLLNNVEVSKGEVFYIPAGRVHSIGKGVLIAEIQQTSDITYRIYDYDRRDANGNTRELHTNLALDAINYDYAADFRSDVKIVPNQSSKAVDCPYFTTNVLQLDMPVEKDFPEIDSFIIYMCVDGDCRIEYDDNHSSVAVSRGETILVPAAIKNLCFYPDGKATLLEVYLSEQDK